MNIYSIYFNLNTGYFVFIYKEINWSAIFKFEAFLKHLYSLDVLKHLIWIPVY